MQIFIEIGLIAVLLVISFLYIEKIGWDNNKYSKKRLFIYHMIMFSVLVGISIELNLLYESNTLIHNIKLIILLCGITTLAWKDFHDYKIPNEVILVLVGLRFIIMVVELVTMKKEFFSTFKECMLSCLAIGVFLIIVHFVFKNSIGMGDIKLLMVMALYEGFFGSFCAIFFSMIIVCILGIALMIAKKKGRKDVLPFAPAVLVGTCLSIIMTGI